MPAQPYGDFTGRVSLAEQSRKAVLPVLWGRQLDNARKLRRDNFHKLIFVYQLFAVTRRHNPQTV